MREIFRIHHKNVIEALEILKFYLPCPQTAQIDATAQCRRRGARVRTRADVIVMSARRINQDVFRKTLGLQGPPEYAFRRG